MGLLKSSVQESTAGLVTGFAPEVRPTDHLRAQLRLADALIGCRDNKRAALVYFGLSRLFLRHGKRNEALAVGHRALKLAPAQAVFRELQPLAEQCGHDALPLLRHAMQAHAVTKKTTEVIALLGLIVNLDPRDTTAERQLAEALVEGRCIKEGLRHFRHAATCLEADGDYTGQLEVVMRMNVIEPTDRWALRWLSEIHLQRGEPMRALEYVTRLLNIEENDVIGLETLAQCLAQLDRTAASTGVLARLIATLTAQQRYRDATAILFRAQKWRSGDSAFLHGLETLHATYDSPSPVLARDRGQGLYPAVGAPSR